MAKKKKRKNKILDLSAFNDGYDPGDVAKTLVRSGKKTANAVKKTVTKDDTFEFLSSKLEDRKSGIARDILSGKTGTELLDDLFERKDKNLFSVNEDKREELQKKEEERAYFRKGLFEDGYDFGDIAKSSVGTMRDIGEDLYSGAGRIGEGLIDTVAYGVGSLAEKHGKEELAEDTKKFIARNLINESQFGEKASRLGFIGGLPGMMNQIVNKEDYEGTSVLGDKSDSIVQSGGQLLGTAGLQLAGVPWFVTTGVTGFGAGTEEAFSNDASYEEAGVYGGISAGSEILFEKLGGIKFGGKALDTGLKKQLSQAIADKSLKTLSKFGLDVAAEGTEEVLTEITQNIGQKLTFEDEKTWEELLVSEEAMDNYLEAFIGGAVMGGGFNAGKTVNSIKTGRDYDTGFTDNEQSVVNAEVKKRIEEIEKQTNERLKREAVDSEVDKSVSKFSKTYETLTEEQKSNIREEITAKFDSGELNYETATLSKKERAEIEQQVEEDLRKGYISIDSIESALSSDKTSRIKELEQELAGKPDESRKAEIEAELQPLIGARAEELKGVLGKDIYLQESYRQEALKTQAFERKATAKDTEITKELIESAKNSNMNNTRKMHDLFEYTNKIANETEIKYGFVNNEQLKTLKLTIEDKTVNGLVRTMEDGTLKVLINTDSDKALNVIIGHETTHLLEGTDEYAALQDIVKEYATTKGEYDTKRKQLDELYKGIDADIDSELTADLIGDYLFTDEQFINSLSTKEPNIFQKIYDYIKHVYKMATAGSAEARQLEQVKRRFDKAYKEVSKVGSNSLENIKYLLSKDEKGNDVAVIQEDIFDGKLDSEKPHQYIADYIATEIGNLYNIVENGEAVYIGNDLAGEFTQSKYTKSIMKKRRDLLNAKNQTVQNLGEIIEIAKDGQFEANRKAKHNIDAKYGFYRYETRFALNNNKEKAPKYKATLLIRHDADGRKYLYDIVDIKKEGSLTLTSTAQGDHGYVDTSVSQGNPSKDSIPETEKNARFQKVKRKNM